MRKIGTGKIDKECLRCYKIFNSFISSDRIYCSKQCTKNSLGIPMSQKEKERRSKLFKTLVGEKAIRWIKDRSKVKIGERNLHDPLYKQWHKNVKNRDKWTCRITDINCGGKLEAHHILPWSKFPQLRYEVNNGITLCHVHHPRKRIDEAKLSLYFQELVAEMK